MPESSRGMRASSVSALQAVAFAMIGAWERAVDLMSGDERLHSAGPIGAAALVMLGQTDRAIVALEQLIRARSGVLMFTGSVLYRALHREPRTAALLRAIGVQFE